MNIEKLKETFTNYVSKFDMSDKNILMKYNHTFRVMEYCHEIAVNNNFTEEEIEVSIIIGLLHDYARFIQWTNHQTFSDINSIDHADLAVKMLFEDKEIRDYYQNEKYYPIIYDAIKYHNKLYIPENINPESIKFCELIRDADKLDIFYLYTIDSSYIKEDDELISEEIALDFYKKEAINIKKINNESEHMLLHLAMIYDFNYDLSYKIIKEKEFIQKMFLNVIRKDKFKKYFDYIINFIKERNE